MPSGFLAGSREYLTSSPFLGIFSSFIRASVWWLTASIASLISCVTSLSKVHWSNGLLSIGKRVLGRVQLNGLSLVANPPARISAFVLITFVKVQFYMQLRLIKRFRGRFALVISGLKFLLGEMSWVEAKEYFKKSDIVVLSVGSTEQHGPANPLGTDFLIAGRLGEEVAKRAGVVCLPVIPFGVSSHHRQFGGTIFVSPRTLKKYVKDVCLALKYDEVRKVVVVNGHGGNLAALAEMSREMREEGVFVSVFQWWPAAVKLLPDLFKPEERGHAGGEETSVNMALHSHLVNVAELVDENVRKHMTQVDGLTLPLDTIDETTSGVFGTQTTASAEKGKEVFEAVVNELTRHVEMLKTAKIEDLLSKGKV